MKNTDKFLIGIVIGVILLVAAAFTVAALRPKPAYQAEDTPEGVAHNYLLAIKQNDYERAYGYLSPTVPGFPESPAEFTRDVDYSSYNFRLYDKSSTVSVVSTHVTGERASVSFRETSFNNGGLFGSSQSTVTFALRLQRENEQWKVVGSDQYYWVWCWDDRTGCGF
jgi:hypothetical protein